MQTRHCRRAINADVLKALTADSLHDDLEHQSVTLQFAVIKFQNGCRTDLMRSQVRRVLDQIRGRTYEEALVMLEYMPYRACESIIEVVISVRLEQHARIDAVCKLASYLQSQMLQISIAMTS